MQRLFENFDTLDRFTLSLDQQQDALQCPHCSKSNQMVSHGLIYKQRSIDVRDAVGKRIFCSNRYQRSGCGRTIPLYTVNVLPGLQYSATHLFSFLSALLLNITVKAAYQQATGQASTRNAWRWLKKLDRKLVDFRSFIHRQIMVTDNPFCSQNRRLQLLLTTLKALFSLPQTNHCTRYQLTCQTTFI